MQSGITVPSIGVLYLLLYDLLTTTMQSIKDIASVMSFPQLFILYKNTGVSFWFRLLSFSAPFIKSNPEFTVNLYTIKPLVT